MNPTKKSSTTDAFGLYVEYKLEIPKLIAKINKRKGLNLNVGCGNYTLDGFKSLDFYSKNYLPCFDMRL